MASTMRRTAENTVSVEETKKALNKNSEVPIDTEASGSEFVLVAMEPRASHAPVGLDVSIVESTVSRSMIGAQSNATLTPIAKVRDSPNLDRSRGRDRKLVASLCSQGINASWFLSGIHDSNCALFHAALYPILPLLRLRLEAFVESHQEMSTKWGQFAVTHIANEIIVIAFERRDTWTDRTPVVDWLASFIETASCFRDQPFDSN